MSNTTNSQSGNALDSTPIERRENRTRDPSGDEQRGEGRTRRGRGRGRGRIQPQYTRISHSSPSPRGHRLNPYRNVDVVGGTYIPPIMPENWSHTRLRYNRLFSDDEPRSVFQTMKIRYPATNATWQHNFGCSLATIDNIISWMKGDLLRRNKHSIPQEDCVLLFLKWLKWHQSYKLLGEPFGLGKTSIATIIENHFFISPLGGAICSNEVDRRVTGNFSEEN